MYQDMCIQDTTIRAARNNLSSIYLQNAIQSRQNCDTNAKIVQFCTQFCTQRKCVCVNPQ